MFFFSRFEANANSFVIHSEKEKKKKKTTHKIVIPINEKKIHITDSPGPVNNDGYIYNVYIHTSLVSAQRQK